MTILSAIGTIWLGGVAISLAGFLISIRFGKWVDKPHLAWIILPVAMCWPAMAIYGAMDWLRFRAARRAK